MIEYHYLVQAIADWKAGKRPSTAYVPESAPAQQEMAAYEDVDSGLLIMEEEQAGAAEQAQEFEGVDRTQAYVPEEYDPAGAAQSAEEQAYLEPAHGEQQGYEQGYEQQGYEQQGYEHQASYEQPEAETEAGVEELDVQADDEEQGRDYDLEAVDDFASFDPNQDLAAWFVADRQIEMAWEDDAQRVETLQRYGIRDAQHYYQVRASIERYVQSPEAQERYGGIDDIMQLQMNALSDMGRQEMQARAEGELAGELEPVEGISLQQWAVAQAKIASGGDADEAIAELGVDAATWDRVSAEWNARMSRDTTATIATEYGKAFGAAGQGQYGEAGQAGAAAMEGGADPDGEPPISFEQFVEIEQAQAAAAEQGHDAAEVLQGFGMTPADWGNVSAWWSQYLSRHMMENDQALLHRYNQLQEHYRSHYMGDSPSPDDDVDY